MGWNRQSVSGSTVRSILKIVIAHQLAPGRVYALALLVAGGVKRHLGLFDVVGQGFEQRGPALGRNVWERYSGHKFFLIPFIPCALMSG